MDCSLGRCKPPNGFLVQHLSRREMERCRLPRANECPVSGEMSLHIQPIGQIVLTVVEYKDYRISFGQSTDQISSLDTTGDGGLIGALLQAIRRFELEQDKSVLRLAVGSICRHVQIYAIIMRHPLHRIAAPQDRAFNMMHAQVGKDMFARASLARGPTCFPWQPDFSCVYPRRSGRGPCRRF